MWVPIVLGKRETTKQVHLLGLEITNFIMFFQSVHHHNFKKHVDNSRLMISCGNWFVMSMP
jgi:hypothetical protein